MNIFKSAGSLLLVLSLTLSLNQTVYAKNYRFDDVSENPNIKGDISENGIRDIFDEALLQNHILKNQYNRSANVMNADYNKDNNINIFDLMRMKNDICKNSSELTCTGSDSGDGWKFENGVLSLSFPDDNNWKQYKDLIWSLKLEEGTEIVHDYDFSELPNLKQVSFPSTVRTIGKGAFSGCSELISVTLPEGIIKIEDEAFKDCDSLGIVCLPASVKNISDSAFTNSEKVQIFGESEYVESYCDKKDIKYIPYSIDSMDDVSSYTQIKNHQFNNFDLWHVKEWDDENGEVKNENGQLVLSASDSYITAFSDERLSFSEKGSDIKIIIEAESNDRDLLDHIYGGYVIPEPFNDLAYPKGNVVSCTNENDLYKAKIEIQTSIESVNDVYFQIRLGCNRDSVNGTVKINSFTVSPMYIDSYSSFSESNWKVKRWGDDGGDVSFDNGEMIMSTDDSYITAYGSHIIKGKSGDLLPLLTTVTVESDNEELLEHIYIGRVDIIDDKENDMSYSKGDVIKKEKKGDKYEAVITGVNFMYTNDFFLQLRLGKNSDHVSGSVRVKHISLAWDDNYAKASVGTKDDNKRINQFIMKKDSDKNFDIFDPCDKSYVVSALAMLYRFREGLEKTAGPLDGNGLVTINLKNTNNSAYMSKSSYGSGDDLTVLNEYCLDASKSYIDRIRNQGLGFGEYHEMSHSYVNSTVDKNFVHNADDSGTNFRNFISREVDDFSGMIPIVDDNGHILFDDMVYDSQNTDEPYKLCFNQNTMDTYYQYKDNVCEGYIHDLSYLAYKMIYDHFENEHEGKGKYIFSEFFSGGKNIGYNIDDEDTQNNISLALKNVLVPNFPEYQNYNDYLNNPKKYLNCINCLVEGSNLYNAKMGIKSEKINMSEFLAANEKIATAVRKMLYCDQIDQMYEGGSCDCLYKFMNDKDLHVFCGDTNFDGIVNEKDNTELQYRKK